MPAYGDLMASLRSQRWLAVLTYSGLRLLLLLAVWLLIGLVTPLRGLTSVVVALLVSGGISLFVLNRQRASMSAVVSSFFGRINERIDAAARAEDFDEPVADPIEEPPAASRTQPETQPESQSQPVDEQDQPGVLQNDDQSGPHRT